MTRRVPRPGQPTDPMTPERFSDLAEEVIACLVAGDLAEEEAHRQLVRAAEERAANEAEAVARPYPWPLRPPSRNLGGKREAS